MSDLTYAELSGAQKEAATTLGYTQEVWDEGDVHMTTLDMVGDKFGFSVVCAAAWHRPDPAGALAAALATGFPPELLPTSGSSFIMDWDEPWYPSEWLNHVGVCFPALWMLERIFESTAVDEDVVRCWRTGRCERVTEQLGACCSVMTAAALSLLAGDAVWLRTALVAEERDNYRANGNYRSVTDQLTHLSRVVAVCRAEDPMSGRGYNAEDNSKITRFMDRCQVCVAAVEEYLATLPLLAAQQRLAIGFIYKTTDYFANGLYDCVAGHRDQPLAPPDTAVGMLPRLTTLDVAVRAVGEGGWAWRVAQVRTEIARLTAELGL